MIGGAIKRACSARAACSAVLHGGDALRRVPLMSCLMVVAVQNTGHDDGASMSLSLCLLSISSAQHLCASLLSFRTVMITQAGAIDLSHAL